MHVAFRSPRAKKHARRANWYFLWKTREGCGILPGNIHSCKARRSCQRFLVYYSRAGDKRLCNRVGTFEESQRLESHRHTALGFGVAPYGISNYLLLMDLTCRPRTQGARGGFCGCEQGVSLWRGWRPKICWTIKASRRNAYVEISSIADGASDSNRVS